VNSRTEVVAWLAARQAIPPAGIAGHIAASLGTGGGELPELLARAGVELLRHVASAPQGGRELALDLLAADAFVTYAFEAQAEADVDALVGLADRLVRGGGLA
jgi:hypothetical protein